MSMVVKQDFMCHALLFWHIAEFAPQWTWTTNGKGVKVLTSHSKESSPAPSKKRKQIFVKFTVRGAWKSKTNWAVHRWQSFLPHLCNLSQTFTEKGEREGGKKKSEKKKKQNQLAAYTRHPERYCRDSNISIQCSRACSCVNSFHMSSLQ